MHLFQWFSLSGTIWKASLRELPWEVMILPANALHGPYMLRRATDSCHLFLLETLCLQESLFPTCVSWDIRHRDVEDSLWLLNSCGPEKKSEIKALSCQSPNSVHLLMPPIYSCLKSLNKYLLRWHHVPDALLEAGYREFSKNMSSHLKEITV